MKEKGCHGNEITLQCPKHSTSKIKVETGDEIKLTSSFCIVVCNQIMPCGVHFCSKPCQLPHGHSKCKQMVTFTFDDCQHRAEKQCFQDVHSIPCKSPCRRRMKCFVHPCVKHYKPAHDHNYCTERVDYSCQQCGKQNDRMCWQREEDIQCEGDVIFQFSSCLHTGRKLCYEDAASKKCKVPCLKCRAVLAVLAVLAVQSDLWRRVQCCSMPYL